MFKCTGEKILSSLIMRAKLCNAIRNNTKKIKLLFLLTFHVPCIKLLPVLEKPYRIDFCWR